ncbi:universal stress protein [Actinoplanes sp. NPDC049802]|uniref:universal stress protein n=1 Tax=Actinoplanes sp. NPDC049802 TaxID=3154742 RepID=UPI0033C3A65F
MARPNRFSQVINRYLGAVSYPDPYADRPAPAPAAQPRPAPGGGRVLVGVDDSPISCVAVDHAAIEAELHGWELHLVTVRHRAGDPAGEALLRRLTDRVHASSPAVVVTARVAVGAHPAQILSAEAAGAGLLVVGHRHGRATTTLGRSVADRVARHHTGPVLVVRMPGWPSGPEFGKRPLVVAVDGSPESETAVAFTFAEARARACDVNLLHLAGSGDLVRRLEIHDGVPVHHRIISGDPATALIEESGRAAAVILGRQAHVPLAGSALAPAVALLPQRAYCPVFLVG